MLFEYLQNHIEEINGQMWIHSPLVVSTYRGSEQDNELNELYETAVATRNAAINNKGFMGYIIATERPYRLQALSELMTFESVTDEQIAKLIIFIWTDATLPCVIKDEWLQLLNKYRNTNVFIDSKMHLPERFTVWRGGNADGISWTLDKAIAEKFSTMYGRTGEIHTREITRNDVIFYTNNRQEQEVVLL